MIQSRLIGTENGFIRKLSGFQKSHFIPDSHSQAGQEFIRRIGSEDVKTHAEALFSLIRKQYGLKRREIEYSCDGGTATVRTAQFEVNLAIDQIEENLKQFQITTSIGLIGDFDATTDSSFALCFNAYVDQLIVNFPQAIDVGEAIDRIEDLPQAAEALEYKPDGSAFSLNFEKMDLLLEVTETEITFQLQRTRSLSILLEKSQEALDVLATVKLDPR